MKNFFFSISIILITVSVAFAQEKKTAEQEKKTAENVGIKKNIQTDRPLNIIKIPKPKYPVQENVTICVTGTVRVRVQFLASGKIGEVKAVSTLGYGLTENAIEAAKEIKFEPAVKYGKAVTVVKVIPFNFTIY